MRITIRKHQKIFRLMSYIADFVGEVNNPPLPEIKQSTSTMKLEHYFL